MTEMYLAPVRGVPGKKTLKNFLATAFEPVGTVLYVYGGGWDKDDKGAGDEAVSIGLARGWIEFFRSNDASYKCPDEQSFFAGGYNRCCGLGLDCSGYVGWVLFNTMHTESAAGKCPGYVARSTDIASECAARGWGSLDMGNAVYGEGSTALRRYDASVLRPGDIFSMEGHVWISLGCCKDNSILILHSTSRETGGAGVQLSALGEDKGCEAYRLASCFMRTRYPLWSERYADKVLLIDFKSYTEVSGENAGRFSWNLGPGGVLSDPDGYIDMSPRDILIELDVL